MIPTLETARLRLCPPTMDDWPEFARFMASERSTELGGPFTENSAWNFFCHCTAQWALFGHGTLMVKDVETKERLGFVGINYGPLFPEHELGWCVYSNAEGKGIAFEAATAMKAWAFGELGLKTLVSYVTPSNPRSAMLAERLGAEVDPDANGQDPGDLVYRHQC